MRDWRIVKVFIVGGAVVLLAAAAWLISMRSPTQARSSGVDVPATTLAVRSIAVHSEQWPETIEAFGDIVPSDEMIISAQVEGQPLVELLANVGDRVRSGQVLARFDAAKLSSEVRRFRAEVEQAVAEVSQADSERDRALQLAGSGGISEQNVVQRVTAAQVAVAKLSAAREQLSARELDLERAAVKAPDAGTISARSAQTGMVGVSGLELFRIIRHDKLEWRGELTASQLSHVAPGQKARLSLPGGANASALIRQIAPAMNTQTRLATLYADIEPGGPARAGMYVSGRVALRESLALVIPASGIVVRDGYSLAFSVAREGVAWRVEERRVEVGRRNGKDIEILAGLDIGERVVTQGAGFLNDGDSVRVVDGLDDGTDGGKGSP